MLLILNCHFIVLTAHFSPPCCSWIWVPGWPGLPVLITAVSLQLALMWDHQRSKKWHWPQQDSSAQHPVPCFIIINTITIRATSATSTLLSLLLSSFRRDLRSISERQPKLSARSRGAGQLIKHQSDGQSWDEPRVAAELDNPCHAQGDGWIWDTASPVPQQRQSPATCTHLYTQPCSLLGCCFIDLCRWERFLEKAAS